jgi:hypothetical protein
MTDRMANSLVATAVAVAVFCFTIPWVIGAVEIASHLRWVD